MSVELHPETVDPAIAAFLEHRFPGQVRLIEPGVWALSRVDSLCPGTDLLVWRAAGSLILALSDAQPAAARLAGAADLDQRLTAVTEAVEDDLFGQFDLAPGGGLLYMRRAFLDSDTFSPQLLVAEFDTLARDGAILATRFGDVFGTGGPVPAPLPGPRLPAATIMAQVEVQLEALGLDCRESEAAGTLVFFTPGAGRLLVLCVAAADGVLQIAARVFLQPVADPGAWTDADAAALRHALYAREDGSFAGYLQVGAEQVSVYNNTVVTAATLTPQLIRMRLELAQHDAVRLADCLADRLAPLHVIETPGPRARVIPFPGAFKPRAR